MSSPSRSNSGPRAGAPSLALPLALAVALVVCDQSAQVQASASVHVHASNSASNSALYGLALVANGPAQFGLVRANTANGSFAQIGGAHSYVCAVLVSTVPE